MTLSLLRRHINLKFWTTRLSFDSRPMLGVSGPVESVGMEYRMILRRESGIRRAGLGEFSALFLWALPDGKFGP